MWPIETAPLLGSNFFLAGGMGGGDFGYLGGSVQDGFCLQVIAEKKKVYYYIHVCKNPYPPVVSQGLEQ
jgi:hypothetical protein